MSNGIPTALGCAHVMVHPPAGSVQDVIEPGFPQGGSYPQDTFGSVASYHFGSNNVDAALTPVTNRFYKLVHILKIGQINGWGIGWVGNQVKKMGALGGLTYSTISMQYYIYLELHATSLGTSHPLQSNTD